jgi:hypothetical protein
MFRSRMLRYLVCAGLCAATIGSGVAAAQASKSGGPAQELAKLLEAGKMDAIAAAGSEPDRFVAALFFPGQLLVVSAKYAVPSLLVAQLAKKAYREIYIDLTSASDPESKVFIQDVGADGLKADADGGADSYERGTQISWTFNGEWRKQKMASEDEYKKAYADADAEYAELLTALMQQAR